MYVYIHVRYDHSCVTFVLQDEHFRNTALEKNVRPIVHVTS